MRAITLIVSFYGCALYGFINPLFGVLFFVVITLFRPDNLLWGNQWLGRLHLVTAALVLVGHVYRGLAGRKNGRVGTLQGGNLLTFLAFLVWLVVVSTFARYSSEDSFAKTFELAKVLVFCFLFSKLITTRKTVDWYVATSVGALSLLSLWGVQQGLRGNDRLDTLTVGGSNFLAAQIVLLAPMSLVRIFDDSFSRKERRYFLVCTLSLLLCLFYSGSRGGFLGLSAAVIGLVLRVKDRFRIVVFSLLTAVAVLPLVPDLFVKRIGSLFVDSEERDLSANVRPVLWKIAVRVWQDHPIAGVGLENFSPVKEEYANRVGDIVTSEEMHDHIFGQKRYTHGLYPGVLAEAGFVGLGLFLLLLSRNAFARLPKPGGAALEGLADLGRATQCGLIGFAVASIFGDFQFIEVVYWQIFLVGTVHNLLSSDNPTSGRPSVVAKDQMQAATSLSKVALGESSRLSRG